jgi:hypothetical protein
MPPRAALAWVRGAAAAGRVTALNTARADFLLWWFVWGIEYVSYFKYPYRTT